MDRMLLVLILAACSAKVDGELKDFEAGSVEELPEPVAKSIIGANRGRLATEGDVQRAKAKAEADAAKAKAEADAAKAKAEAAKAKKEKEPAVPPPPAP